MQHPHCALSHRSQSLAEAVTALIPCARLYHWFAFELQETVTASGHPYAGALDEGRVHARGRLSECAGATHPSLPHPQTGLETT